MRKLGSGNKFGRAINEIGDQVARLRPGQVAGSLVDSTTNGTFIRPMRNPRVRVRSSGSGLSRWH